jgi:HYR domain
MKTLIALLIAAVALPVGASSAAKQSSGTLNVNTTVGSGYRFGLQYCPPATPGTTTDCVRFMGAAGIPGLGSATVTYVKSFDDTICPGRVVQQKTALVDVVGKGRLEIAMDYPVCSDLAPSSVVNRGTISGGTGIYAGATGTLQFASTVNAPSCGGGGCVGGSTDTWTGSLAVPGREFDLTAPVFQPVASRRVKAPEKAKTVRVRYAPQAQDAVDGPMPVACKPASGSRFKVGRTTRVSCTAEDTSANVATTSFTVKITRRR